MLKLSCLHLLASSCGSELNTGGGISLFIITISCNGSIFGHWLDKKSYLVSEYVFILPTVSFLAYLGNQLNTFQYESIFSLRK